MHGERETEQAAGVSVLPQDVGRVQVEAGQSPTGLEQDQQQQRQSAGEAALHGVETSTSAECGTVKGEPSLRTTHCLQEGLMLSALLAAAPPTGLPWHSHACARTHAHLI